MKKAKLKRPFKYAHKGIFVETFEGECELPNEAYDIAKKLSLIDKPSVKKTNAN